MRLARTKKNIYLNPNSVWGFFLGKRKMQQQLIAQIKRHEGLKLKPYRCVANKLTLGYGRNLDDCGISAGEAEFLLFNDIQAASDRLHRLTNEKLEPYTFYLSLSDARKAVLVNMLFNLGLPRFKGFKRFLAALESRDYALAADEMLDSRWARQVGQRAIELENQMRSGEWQ